MKIKITLSYDGSKFRGSQIQKEHDQTVASKLSYALSCLNIYSKINFSGRTDSGVHALAGVVDLELPSFWKDLDKLKSCLNRICLPEIYIKKIQKVDSNFHARFSAKRRVYRYMISTNEVSVFLNSYITFVKSIDENKIQEAIKLFEGKHNFSLFKKSNSDTKSDICTIYKTRFYKYNDLYIMYFEADRFLRSQIRMMVGFLLKISESKLTTKDLIEQLSCKKLHNCTLALPNGLYLAKIKY